MLFNDGTVPCNASILQNIESHHFKKITLPDIKPLGCCIWALEMAPRRGVLFVFSAHVFSLFSSKWPGIYIWGCYIWGQLGFVSNNERPLFSIPAFSFIFLASLPSCLALRILLRSIRFIFYSLLHGSSIVVAWLSPWALRSTKAIGYLPLAMIPLCRWPPLSTLNTSKN